MTSSHSKVTGDPKYKTAVARAMKHVLALDRSKSSNLFPNFVSLQSAGFSSPLDVRLGAMGDSFYEYLFKTWWYVRVRPYGNPSQTYNIYMLTPMLLPVRYCLHTSARVLYGSVPPQAGRKQPHSCASSAVPWHSLAPPGWAEEFTKCNARSRTSTDTHTVAICSS